MTPARRISITAMVLAAVLLAVTSAFGYRAAAHRLNSFPRQMLSQEQPGWMDAFRALYRLPDVARFRVSATSDGDGAEALYVAAETWRPGPSHRGPPTHADSALWRAVAEDTNLNRVIAAARFHSWDGCKRAMGQGANTDFYAFRAPPLGSITVAFQALRVRAQSRLARRNFGGARADLDALITLGDQMLRHEPTLTGMGLGQQAIRLALDPYVELARVTHDSASAAQLRLIQVALQPWADSGFILMGPKPQLLEVEPDSAFKMALDSSFALWWRRFALFAYVAAHLNRPRGVLLGIPSSTSDTLTSLRHDRNSDFARIAAAAVNAVERLNRGSVRERWRLSALWSGPITPL